MQFCIDCKHHQPGATDGDDLCGHPKAVRAVSYVRGQTSIMHCESMRFGSCGEEAKLFEAKLPAEAAQ